jgi:hypothetical protein
MNICVSHRYRYRPSRLTTINYNVPRISQITSNVQNLCAPNDSPRSTQQDQLAKKLRCVSRAVTKTPGSCSGSRYPTWNLETGTHGSFPPGKHCPTRALTVLWCAVYLNPSPGQSKHHPATKGAPLNVSHLADVALLFTERASAPTHARRCFEVYASNQIFMIYMNLNWIIKSLVSINHIKHPEQFAPKNI